VERDGGRELDERGAARDPDEAERRPELADADVQVLRHAAEHGRHDRRLVRLRRDGGLCRLELGRRALDVAAVVMSGDVIGRPDAGDDDQDAGDDEQAAHPADSACGGRPPGALRSRRGGSAAGVVRRARTRPPVAADD
jgi:hypothetical protein